MLQQGEHLQFFQELKELIQQCAGIQRIHPVHDLLAVQAPRHAHIIALCHLPTQPLGQVRRDRFPCLLHDPPPSLEGYCYRGKWDTDQALPDLQHSRSMAMRLGPPSGRDTYIGTSVIYQYFSVVVICHAGTRMLPLDRAENPDKDKGVWDGIANY